MEPVHTSPPLLHTGRSESFLQGSKTLGQPRFPFGSPLTVQTTSPCPWEGGRGALCQGNKALPLPKRQKEWQTPLLGRGAERSGAGSSPGREAPEAAERTQVPGPGPAGPSRTEPGRAGPGRAEQGREAPGLRASRRRVPSRRHGDAGGQSAPSPAVCPPGLDGSRVTPITRGRPRRPPQRPCARGPGCRLWMRHRPSPGSAPL